MLQRERCEAAVERLKEEFRELDDSDEAEEGHEEEDEEEDDDEVEEMPCSSQLPFEGSRSKDLSNSRHTSIIKTSNENNNNVNTSSFPA